MNATTYTICVSKRRLQQYHYEIVIHTTCLLYRKRRRTTVFAFGGALLSSIVILPFIAAIAGLALIGAFLENLIEVIGDAILILAIRVVAVNEGIQTAGTKFTIFNVLGNSSAQIKIMMVLCGTKEGFFISGKWMQGRTGLPPQSYSSALKKLVKRGWVTHRNYQTIRVNFDKIYEDGRQLDEMME